MLHAVLTLNSKTQTFKLPTESTMKISVCSSIDVYTGVVRVTRTHGRFLKLSTTRSLLQSIIIVYYTPNRQVKIIIVIITAYIRPIMLWIVISWPGNTDDNNYYYCHYNGVRVWERERSCVRFKTRSTWLQQSTQDVIIITEKKFAIGLGRWLIATVCPSPQR